MNCMFCQRGSDMQARIFRRLRLCCITIHHTRESSLFQNFSGVQNSVGSHSCFPKAVP